MEKLKSKTGCLTCLARRKKCDEASPKCGHCARLNLTCARREQTGDGASIAISSTNLRPKKGLTLHSTITNGYPSFGSEFEKQLSLESPGALAALVSCMAGPGFRDVLLFGTFSTESRLVRHALVAFSAHNQGPRCEDSYKLSLRSYQNCVTDLKTSRLFEGSNPVDQNHALTAIMFLGLLEGLNIGDSSNAVTHFEMCERLLITRLSQPGVLGDPALVKLYRVAAECIIYNLATLAPFDTRVDRAISDWGTSFDCLFPGGDHNFSPFLGGFHDVYRLMLKINIYLRKFQPVNSAQPRLDLHQDPSRELSALWSELCVLENKVPASYRRVEGAKATKLYIAKHKISVLALRVHLVKVTEPTTSPSDELIQGPVQRAIDVLRRQDIREPGNPALRWPLTILASAAEEESDFQFFVERMKELELILDPANSGKIRTSYTFLQQYRDGTLRVPLPTYRGDWVPKTQLDILLEPMSSAESYRGLGVR